MKATHPPIPMSYKPKIKAVRSGRCRQTIRKGSKYAVGQRRWIFAWSRKPYRSTWAWKMLVEITNVDEMEVDDDGVQLWPTAPFCDWSDSAVVDVARRDFIDPPTGEELCATLRRLHGKEWEGPYRIITWKPIEAAK